MTFDSVQPEVYRLLVEEALVGMYLIQDDRLVYANRKLAQLFGYTLEEMMQFPSILDVIADHDRERVRETIRQRLSGEIASIEHTVERLGKNKTPIVMDIKSVRGFYDGRPAVLGTVVDITSRKRFEDTLRALALVDELTGLYNRRGFMTLAERQVLIARRTRQSLILLAADLDGLKSINDRYGHAAGDQALQGAASVLKHTYREADIIARVGGDEFTVFPLYASDTSVPILLERLHRNLREWNAQHRPPYTLSMSTGSARLEADSKDLLQLLAEADSQLYQQKRERIKSAPAGLVSVPFWATDRE